MINIDLESIIKKHLEFKERDMNAYPDFDGGVYQDDLHTGMRRDPVYHTQKDRHPNPEKEGWNSAGDNQVSPTYQDYPESSWIEAREYDPEHGICTIYFDPYETNGKPPVVVGVGKPVDWAFVHSLDNGIQSGGNGYSKRSKKRVRPRPNSQGAFYKQYIQQYHYIYDYDGVIIGTEPNKSRIVEAVSLDDLEGPIEGHNHRVLNSLYHIPKKRWLNQMRNEVKKSVKEWATNHVIETLKSKGWYVNKNAVLDKLINKLNLDSIINKVKSYNGAKAELTRLINKKGAARIVSTRKGRRAGMKALRKGAVISEGAAETMAVGAAAAPETAGMSVLIAAGVTVSMSLFKRQKMSQRMHKTLGSEGMGSIQIYALKKVIKDDIALHIKRTGIKPFIAGVKEHNSLKWSDNKHGINERGRTILSNSTNLRGLWDQAGRDAVKNSAKWRFKDTHTK